MKTLKLGRAFPYIFLTVVSLWSLWPTVANFKTSLPLGHEDLILTWIINQNIQKIPHDVGNIFNGNIFYPYKNTLAYSDLFFPSSLISFVAVKISGSFLAGFNFALILGQFLTLFILFFWLKEITKNNQASLLGTIVFGLSQIRMHYFVHIHTFILQWFILSGYFIWKFSVTNRVRYLYYAAISTSIQFWESPLPVFWVFALSFIFLLSKIKILIGLKKHLVVIVSLFSFLISPLALAYLYVSREFQYVRPIREAAHFSMSINDIWGMFFSPGLLILGITALIFIFKSNLDKRMEIKNYLIVATVGIVMALGPVLKWYGSTLKILGKIFIPLPYGVFYYLVPGFGALRTPSRWMVLFALGVSILVAIAFSKFKSRYNNLIFIAALIAALLGGTRVSGVVNVTNKEDYPAVYEWLKVQGGDAVIELPVYTWGDGKIYKNEYYRMLFSLYHEKKLVNGASGFDPSPWQKLITDVNNLFPESPTVKKLEGLGVDYIIVHKNEIDNKKFQDIEKWGKDRTLYNDGNDVVYKL